MSSFSSFWATLTLSDHKSVVALGGSSLCSRVTYGHVALMFIVLDDMELKVVRKGDSCIAVDCRWRIYNIIYFIFTFFNLLEIHFGHCLVYVFSFLCIFSILVLVFSIVIVFYLYLLFLPSH